MNSFSFKPIFSLGIMIPFLIIMIVIILVNKKNIIVRIIIALMVFVISQRPLLKDGKDDIYKYNLDIIFAIDNTISMNAVDVNNDTRLKAVKADCKAIINEFPGANYAVLTFNNLPEIRTTLTDDMALAIEMIDGIEIVTPYYASGSTIGVPLEYIELILNTAKEKNVERKKKNKVVLFFISDGEFRESNNNTISSYSKLKELIDDGAVLGYGEETGAKMFVGQQYVGIGPYIDKDGYLIDGNTTPRIAAISKYSDKYLKSLSNALSIDFYHMTNYNVLNSKIVSIKKMISDANDGEDEAYIELYYYFAIVLLIMLFTELYYYRRSI